MRRCILSFLDFMGDNCILHEFIIVHRLWGINVEVFLYKIISMRFNHAMRGFCILKDTLALLVKTQIKNMTLMPNTVGIATTPVLQLLCITMPGRLKDTMYLRQE